MIFKTALALTLLCVGMVGSVSMLPAQEAPLTPKSLLKALAASPTGATAEKLAARVQEWFGKEALAKGANPKVEGLTVAWAVQANEDAEIEAVDEKFRLHLTRLGSTDVFVGAITLSEGAGMVWRYRADGKYRSSGAYSQREHNELFHIGSPVRSRLGCKKGTPKRDYGRLYQGAQ